MDKLLYTLLRGLARRSRKLNRAMHKVVRDDLSAPDADDVEWLHYTLEAVIPSIVTHEALLAKLLASPELVSALHDSQKSWAAFRELLRQEPMYKKLLGGSFVQENLNKNPLPAHIVKTPAALQALKDLISRPAVRDALLAHESAATALAKYAGELLKNNAAAYEQLQGFTEFQAFWGKVRLDLAEELRAHANIGEIAREVTTSRDLRAVFHKHFCGDETLRLKLGTIKLPDSFSYWVQLHELFANEDYYFECGEEAPYIIDAGAHMGLAVYYFKSRFPGARVTAFEPNPALRELAQENVRRCGFEHVEVLPYALSGEEKTAVFQIARKDSMASSLSPRPTQGEEYEAVTVECKRLSAWLDRPVDLLKLDIEGEEDQVLAESANRLRMAHYIFCEYHQGEGLPASRLPRILQLLDEAGFDFHVGKAWSWQKITGCRPFTHVDKPYSAIVWAKNRTWPPPDAH